MKKLLITLLTALSLFLCINENYGQAPDLGSASGFAAFTGVGAFEVFGASTIVTGDVGTNVGSFIGFPPGELLGNIYYPGDPVAVQAAVDLINAYGYLDGLTCGAVLTNPLGNGQILAPNIYCLGDASTLNGELILDGQGDPDALFIFQIDGAFATSTFTNVTLINSASLCNVYWQVNGVFTLGEGSVFRGNVLANGALHLLEGAYLYGRALSQAGAVDLHSNIVTIGLFAEPSIIEANGPTTFCEGDEVVLSGNVGGIWSTGESTPSITVNTSGDYFVTNTNSCGMVVSNHIIVTVNPLPLVLISGNTEFCSGQSSILTASEGISYLWSTSESTQSITVTQAGTYSVVVTDINGCEGDALILVNVNPLPIVNITGDTEFCLGQSSVLTASQGVSYLWSTSETTQSITVTQAGTYSVIVTDINGCEGDAEVSVSFLPVTIPECPANMNVLTTDAPFTLSGGIPLGGIYYLNGLPVTVFDPAVAGIGTHIITYSIEDICGPQSCTFNIIVSEESIPCEDAIIFNFPLTAQDVCVGEPYSIDFTNTVIENAIDTIWEVNPVTAGVIENKIFTLNNGYVGLVTITLTAIAEVPCNNAFVSISFTVDPLPIVDISGDTEFCLGESTVLTASVGISYLWSTNETTQSIIVNLAGTYSVVVTDINGCEGNAEVSVSYLPVTIPVCPANMNVMFTDSPFTLTGGIPSGGTYYLNGIEISVFDPAVAGIGTHIITYSIEDICGPQSCTFNIIVSEESLPCEDAIILNFPLTAQDVCVGEPYSIDFTNTVIENAIDTIWEVNPVTAGVIENKIFTLNNGYVGLVTITLTAIAEVPCNNAFVSISFTVDPLPIVNISGDTEFCLGESTVLTASLGISYLWSTNETTQSIIVNLAGTYSVVVTDINGCEGSAEVSVSYLPVTIPVCPANMNVMFTDSPFTLTGGTLPAVYIILMG